MNALLARSFAMKSLVTLPSVKNFLSIKKAGFFLAAVFCVAVIGSRASAQTTYTWNQTGTASFATSTNWTPTRTTPAVDDVLVFNNAATTTATAVPTQTIGQLSVDSNTTVNLQAAGAGTILTIAGGVGTDLSVTAGSQLNVNVATNTLAITVATGATGSISGAMTYTLAAHTLIAADAGGITFNSGATFTQGTGTTGNVFGAGTSNSVVFASGSTFVQVAGSNPFQKAQPASVVVFQTGSLFSLQGNTTPSFSGRTYANFELNIAATVITVTGGAAVSINDLTVTAGTLNFNMTAAPGHAIKGNISVASGATLNFNPLTAGTVDVKGNISVPSGATLGVNPTVTETLNLSGSSAQSITGTGTITTSSASTINMNNANGLTLFRDVTLGGPLTLTSGNITTDVANTLIISSTGSVTHTSGHVIGNLRKTYTASATKAFEVGTANGYSPVTVSLTAGTFPADFTVKAVQSAQPNVHTPSSALQRYWTLTGSLVTATLILNYLDADVPPPPSSEDSFVIFKYDGTFTTPGGSVSPGSNFATISGVSFTGVSDWTLAQPNAPTAAPGTISGIVTRSDGTPLGGVLVNLNGGTVARAITNGHGAYHIDNVPTGGFYTVTPALANYHFAPASRSFSLVGNQTDAGFMGNADDSASTNALDTTEYFVRQQYLDFLGREPDQGGWLYWTNQISACGNNQNCINQRRVDVSAAFFESPEFEQTGSFVYRLYQTGLGRQLTFAEFSADRVKVLGGADLEANRTAFADAFVARPEFMQKYQDANTAGSFVDALLTNVSQSSGVDLSAQRDALMATYGNGGDQTESRSLVLRALSDNAVIKSAAHNPSFVLMEYFGYLQRGADTGGYDFWLNVLNGREAGNYRGMVCAFLTSAEYQHRFSPIITHSNAECGP